MSTSVNSGSRYRVPAVVCDSDKLSQIAIIQELGRRGIPVVALSTDRSAIGFASKYAGTKLVAPAPSYDERFIGFLLGSVPRGVLYYSNDASVELIARHKERLLAAGFSLLVSGATVIDSVVNKDRLFEVARQCGVRVPKCFLVASYAEAVSRAQETGYPLALKSTNLAGGIYALIPSPELLESGFLEMERKLQSEPLRHRASRLMVQEWIPQRNQKLWNFNACVQSGDIVSFSIGERIRSDTRPDGTIGSALLYGKTAANDHILNENRRLLKHLALDGIVETEWSQDAGQPEKMYLYDFNPRPSGNIRWTFKAGVSLAEHYYRLSLGLPVEARPMKPGTKYYKLFYTVNDAEEALGNALYSWRDRARVWLEDLWGLLNCRRHAIDILDFTDLSPTIRAARPQVTRAICKCSRLLGAKPRRMGYRIEQRPCA